MANTYYRKHHYLTSRYIRPLNITSDYGNYRYDKLCDCKICQNIIKKKTYNKHRYNFSETLITIKQDIKLIKDRLRKVEINKDRYLNFHKIASKAYLNDIITGVVLKKTDYILPSYDVVNMDEYVEDDIMNAIQIQTVEKQYCQECSENRKLVSEMKEIILKFKKFEDIFKTMKLDDEKKDSELSVEDDVAEHPTQITITKSYSYSTDSDDDDYVVPKSKKIDIIGDIDSSGEDIMSELSEDSLPDLEDMSDVYSKKVSDIVSKAVESIYGTDDSDSFLLVSGGDITDSDEEN